MVNQCKGMTKKGEPCRKKTIEEYCHIHKSQKVIEKTKNEISSLNKGIAIKHNKLKSMEAKVEELEEELEIKELNYKSKIHQLEDLVEENCEEITRLNQMLEYSSVFIERYKVIVKFEKLKDSIKNTYNWKSEFYIDDIRNNSKYHKILENKFKKPVNDIIEEYENLRILRNKYAHDVNFALNI